MSMAADTRRYGNHWVKLYNPGSKEPNIDDVLDSLNAVGKK